MKRAIDAKSKSDANFDTITVKRVNIVNAKGKTMAYLGSNPDNEG